MKKIITALIMTLLFWAPSPAMSQKIVLDKTLHIKTLDSNNIDLSAEIKSKLTLSKSTSISFDLGYGTLIGGNVNGFQNPTSSIGPLGSGIINSPFFPMLAKMGTPLLGQNILGWGKSGINLSMTGSLGKTFSFQGIYSGFNSTYAVSFAGTTGSMTGKGTVISSEGKISQLQSDISVKFVVPVSNQ